MDFTTATMIRPDGQTAAQAAVPEFIAPVRHRRHAPKETQRGQAWGVPFVPFSPSFVRLERNDFCSPLAGSLSLQCGGSTPLRLCLSFRSSNSYRKKYKADAKRKRRRAAALQRKRTSQRGTKVVTFQAYKTGRKQYKLNTSGLTLWRARCVPGEGRTPFLTEPNKTCDVSRDLRERCVYVTVSKNGKQWSASIRRAFPLLSGVIGYPLLACYPDLTWLKSGYN